MPINMTNIFPRMAVAIAAAAATFAAAAEPNFPLGTYVYAGTAMSRARSFRRTGMRR